ncbi:Arginyl-tRNA--protein transferase 1 [Golovinomyces cichoracearum]|uniref:arginyltransferase n=1 Tax=Golovinomyces cichoracearum TaxID=62708 RepID=A0A420IMK7_9PEZI|nr:Arginyl-tRNA--protein transferase 1 [Golovinomyces cichoracearum]
METSLEHMSSIRPDCYSDIKCGYCGNASGNISYQVYATDLTAEFYQKLLDRGWRRSGTVLYKPDLRASCCPPYAIRVDSLKYRPSKDQRQKLNRFNKQMIGQRYLQAAARLYPLTREQAKKRKQDFDLIERIHESEVYEQKGSLQHDHSFVVTLEESNFSEEKYSLYENYQRVVHRQSPTTIDRNAFTSFLCDSPVRNKLTNNQICDQQIGTYHQCYRIDGILVAMGVLDLLPNCVSAIYFMYHENVKKFDFGKLSAMREIALAKENGYHWWYPGFYIHDCIKMRYKAEYSPVYILGPESYQWQLFTKDLKHAFSIKKYHNLIIDSTKTPTCPLTHLSDFSKFSDEDCINEDPSHVIDADVPLFARNMPGILTREELPMESDLGKMFVKLYYTERFACNLEDWGSSSIDDLYSIKGIVAEVFSAFGLELCKEIFLNFQ